MHTLIHLLMQIQLWTMPSFVSFPHTHSSAPPRLHTRTHTCTHTHTLSPLHLFYSHLKTFECLGVHASIVSHLLSVGMQQGHIFPGAFKTTYQLVLSTHKCSAWVAISFDFSLKCYFTSDYEWFFFPPYHADNLFRSPFSSFMWSFLLFIKNLLVLLSSSHHRQKFPMSLFFIAKRFNNVNVFQWDS